MACANQDLHIARVLPAHCALAFVFNTTVLALLINIGASLV